MNKNLLKSTLREITSSFGRYSAILIIIVLGVGLLAGLGVCQDSMLNMADHYMASRNMYDYRVLSSLGFTEEDVIAFSNEDAFTAVNAAYTIDALVDNGDRAEKTVRFHSITEDINQIKLLNGKIPTSGNECLADPAYYNEIDIGTRIYVSKNNTLSVFDTLAHESYTIVGIADFPYYLNKERGKTEISSENIVAYICLPEEGFQNKVYHELFITIPTNGKAYSDAYQTSIETYDEMITKMADERVNLHYEELINQIQTLQAGLNNELVQETPDSILLNSPSTFVLTREANVGYVNFQNDSSIVSEVAKVFPIFFCMVAALVCITTMTRMIDEQRTQIGVLKSMGYGSHSILGKYFIYSGSAGILGCFVGFFGGSCLIPWVVAKAYSMSYTFLGGSAFLFNPSLLIVSLIATFLCTVGITWFCCQNALRHTSAILMRPKAPKSGKRILLERVTPLWSRIPFLHKVTFRNLFRYKQRFFMMILGISGCTALMVTGLGLRDSFADIANKQYGEILLYDAQVDFFGDLSVEDQEQFIKQYAFGDYLFASVQSVDVLANEKTKSVPMIALQESGFSAYIHMRNSDGDLSFPAFGEIALDIGLSKDLGIVPGEVMKLRNTDGNTVELRISGIYDNYMGNGIYLSSQTYTHYFSDYKANGAFVRFDGSWTEQEAAAKLLNSNSVSNVSINSDNKTRFESMIVSLNYVIYTLILFAGALAFVVIYNLTNINISERQREIATVKVLGFFEKESSAYIFRENNILTFISAGIGLALGNLLLAYVIQQIKVDGLSFSFYVSGVSYGLAFILTILFAFLIQIFMKRKLNRIHMAESLKTVE